MSGVLTALILFGIFPGIILGFILLSRYLKFRETKLMLEHGITPPQHLPPPPAPMPQMMPPMYARAPMPMPQHGPMPPRPMPPRPSRAQLTWGLVLSGIGLALTLCLWPIGLIANGATGEGAPKFPLGLGPWMLGGFIPLFVGLALILGHVATHGDRPMVPNPPAPFPTGEGGARWAPPLAPPPLSLTEEMLLRPDPLAPPRPAAPVPPLAEAAHPEPPAADVQTQPPVVRERE